MSDLHLKTLVEIRDLLANKKITVKETVESCLGRIEATEPKLKAFLHLRAQEAMKEASALDAAGPDPDKPLWGVPLAIKDNIAAKEMPTTCGSKILEGFVPFYDAYVAKQLRQAGAVLLGKTNMDEFGMGSTTEFSAYHSTLNPWDTGKVAGGSSGGSAAGVAARQFFGALGTDTGGSIRQPASLCGCVGLKPTYGRVSRYGMVAYGSSFDQIGPLARTVKDAAVLLQTISGHDDRDSTCLEAPVPDYAALLAERGDLKGLKLGLPKEFWSEGLAPETEKPLRAAVETARSLGAEVVEISLPRMKYAVAAYYIMAMAEASSNLARFDGVRYGLRDRDAKELPELYRASRSAGFGDEVQRRIMLGTYVLSAGYYDAYYRKAAQVRRLMLEDFDKAFEQCDLLCGPTSPVTAWNLGTLTADPLKMYLMDVFTLPMNMTGQPGLSLPVGLEEGSGMPVGLQLMGKALDEGTLLSVSHVLEQALPTLPMPRAVA